VTINFEQQALFQRHEDPASKAVGSHNVSHDPHTSLTIEVHKSYFFAETQTEKEEKHSNRYVVFLLQIRRFFLRN
jgi:hypothetical protein